MFADTIPSASSPRIIRADDGLRSVHAWFAVPTISGQSASLMHVPPRDGLGMTGPGTARKAADLPFVPDGLAASGEALYIILPVETTLPKDTAQEKQRRVVSLRARPIASGFWDFEPPRGRVEPRLPGDGELIDAVGGVDGPAVLLGPVAGESGDASEWRLFTLHEGVWESIALTKNALPTDLAPHGLDRVNGGGAFSHARLLSVGSRTSDSGEFRLIVQRSGVRDRAEVWRVVHESRSNEQSQAEDKAADTPRTAWRFELVGQIALPAGKAIESLTFRIVDGRVIASAVVDGPIIVWAMDADRVTELNRIENVPLQYATLGLTGLSRLSVVSAANAPASTGESSTGTGAMPGASRARGAGEQSRELKFVEVSTLNGAELFAASAKREGPLTRRDVGTLALIVSAMTAVVLLFVLRADNTNVVRLPRGYSLAAPARRFVAAMIDFLPGYFIAVWSMGVSLSQVFLAGFGGSGFETVALFNGMDALTAGVTLIIASLVAAAAHCAVGEWLLGRSLGKLLTGCEVISVADQHARKNARSRRGSAPSAADEPGERKDGGEAVDGEADRAVPVQPAEAQRITLWQAVVRNAVRWIPPLAILVVLDPNFRHPGDVLAGTVVALPPEPEEDEEDDDRADEVR